jgi:hypothetical protein
MYRVVNIYGISGTSSHRTPKSACKAARRREGDGWVVVDSQGNQWTMFGDRAVIVLRFIFPMTRTSPFV